MSQPVHPPPTTQKPPRSRYICSCGNAWPCRAAITAHQPFRLMDLPPELRTHILEMALSEARMPTVSLPRANGRFSRPDERLLRRATRRMRTQRRRESVSVRPERAVMLRYPHAPARDSAPWNLAAVHGPLGSLAGRAWVTGPGRAGWLLYPVGSRSVSFFLRWLPLGAGLDRPGPDSCGEPARAEGASKLHLMADLLLARIPQHAPRFALAPLPGLDDDDGGGGGGARQSARDARAYRLLASFDLTRSPPGLATSLSQDSLPASADTAAESRRTPRIADAHRTRRGRRIGPAARSQLTAFMAALAGNVSAAFLSRRAAATGRGEAGGARDDLRRLLAIFVASAGVAFGGGPAGRYALRSSRCLG